MTNERTVEDLDDRVESRIRWVEQNRVLVFSALKEPKDGNYDWIVPPPPSFERLEGIHPPALIGGAEPGKVKYLSHSGVRIQEAPPHLERRRIEKKQRMARWAERQAVQLTGATVEGRVDRGENGPTADATQGEVGVVQGDGGNELQEEVRGEEEVDAQEHVEGEEVRAQESIEEQEEDDFVSTFRETFSPPPNWYDDGLLSEPDELSLEA